MSAAGAEAPPDERTSARRRPTSATTAAENFVSPGGATPDAPRLYTAAPPRLNEWGLTGKWTVGSEHAALDRKDGSIVYRFHARDLHLVLGPGRTASRCASASPSTAKRQATSHGADVDADGHGIVTGQRLYQLVRQAGAIADRTFEIQFLDAGVEAFAFTFG